MNIDTALRLRDSRARELGNVFDMAKKICPTSKAMNEKTVAIVHEHDGPRWVTEYLSGYRAALQRDIDRNCIVYGGYLDGVFYSVNSQRADYYGNDKANENRWAEWDKNAKNLGLYWITQDQVHPYFISND